MSLLLSYNVQSVFTLSHFVPIFTLANEERDVSHWPPSVWRDNGMCPGTTNVPKFVTVYFTHSITHFDSRCQLQVLITTLCFYTNYFHL